MRPDAGAGRNVKVGERNNRALEYANHLLFTLEWGEQEVRDEMKQWNESLKEPLPEEELARTVENAISYHRKESRENPMGAGKERKEDKELLMEFMEGEIERIVKSANDPSMVYCVVEVGDANRVMELESSEIEEWLSAAYHIKTRRIPSKELCERIPKTGEEHCKSRRDPLRDRVQQGRVGQRRAVLRPVQRRAGRGGG